MRTLLRNGQVFQQNRFCPRDLVIEDGRILFLAAHIPPVPGVSVLDCSHCLLVPGFADVHVHLREPGFFYKETVETAVRAGRAGGFTRLCAMPNVSPVPDGASNLAVSLSAFGEHALRDVFPYGSITVGERGEALADYGALAPFVCGFSDDGRGVQDEDVMRRAMRGIRKTGKVLAAHCEVEALVKGGCVHDGAYAKRHGLPGIDSASEWRAVARDIALSRETGCPLHICHVSTAESVRLIREAKRAGVDVTAETAPHYLLLTDEALSDDGRFKMNPPIRGERDRDALIEALADGTIDLIATDHAPHAAAEKAGGLRDSLMGVVGLETAFAVLLTGLVQPGLISLETLVARMALAPRQRFGLPGGRIEPGEPADLAVIEPEARWTIEPDRFSSKGRATPFAGRAVVGRARALSDRCIQPSEHDGGGLCPT